MQKSNYTVDMLIDFSFSRSPQNYAFQQISLDEETIYPLKFY